MDKQQGSFDFGYDPKKRITGVQKGTEHIQTIPRELVDELYHNASQTVARLKKSVHELPGLQDCRTRESLCRGIAAFVCSGQLFSEYVQSLKPEELRVLLRAVYSWGLPFPESLAELHITLSERPYYGYDMENSNLPFNWCINYENSGIQIKPVMKKYLQRALSQYRVPVQTVRVDTVAALPGFFSAAQGIPFFTKSVQIMYILKNAGFFERKSGMAVLKGIRKKIADIVPLLPFITASQAVSEGYTPAQAEKLENVRVDLCLAFLAASFTRDGECYADVETIPSEPLELYRMCMRNFFASPNLEYDLKYVYPQVKVSDYSYNARKMSSYRKQFLHTIPDRMKQWKYADPVLFRDFLDRSQEDGFPSPAAPGDCYYYTGYKNTDQYSYTERCWSNSESRFRSIVYDCSYTNLFLLFAALGLFEITWQNAAGKERIEQKNHLHQNNMNLYCFGRIEYIRMTPLGAAVFGLTDHFDYDEESAFPPPVPGKEDTIVHIDPDDRVMQLFLETFCSRLGAGLYKADSAKLARISRTPGKVESLFDSLGRYAKEELPPVWRQLQKDCGRKMITLKQETGWIIISLTGQSPDFIHAVETLPSAGIDFLRMEGCRIAVQQNQLHNFTAWLESRGFDIGRIESAAIRNQRF
jgi:hypothetical protein